jgi:hypothetical protein
LGVGNVNIDLSARQYESVCHCAQNPKNEMSTRRLYLTVFVDDSDTNMKRKEKAVSRRGSLFK